MTRDEVLEVLQESPLIVLLSPEEIQNLLLDLVDRYVGDGTVNVIN